jgi:7,8-dihydropterin-6-yl-methyl-4-(beta-D-ribofuranosyl)aminobenzene 5'-phosphate synthase
VLAYPEVFPLSLFKPRGSEQALVVHVTGEGLVLITGCGHPTVEKLVTRAEALYGQPVVGVVGGLHYGEANAEDLTDPIAFLASREPRLVALSPHDSGPAAIEAFRAAFPEAYREVMVGQPIRFPEG